MLSVVTFLIITLALYSTAALMYIDSDIPLIASALVFCLALLVSGITLIAWNDMIKGNKNA
jgi:hypothetical protein